MLMAGLDCADLGAAATTCGRLLTAYNDCSNETWLYADCPPGDLTSCFCELVSESEIRCHESTGECRCYDCRTDPDDCEDGIHGYCDFVGSPNCSPVESCCAAYFGIAGM
jgi:hypothetical protein